MNKTEFLKRMSDPDTYMHITEDLNHNGEFYIRVPKNRLQSWSEDGVTPRACVAEFLNGCLSSICVDKNTLIKVFFVDINKLGLKNHIIKADELYDKNLVTDAIYTREAWILKDFKVPEEDSVIISLDCVNDEETLFLVESDVQKEADKLGVDVVDFYEEKYGFAPQCISWCSVEDNDFTIFNKDTYEEFWKTTQMIEGEEDCLLDFSGDLYEYEDEMEELEDFKEIYNVSFLGEGGGRKVFSFNNFAIKLPKSEDGELQTRKELKIYNDMKNELIILNPSYKLLYNDTVVQPKLLCFDKSNCDNYSNIIDYLKNEDFDEEYINKVESDINTLIEKYDLMKMDLIKMDSWGVKEDYDDKVYLYDYGITNKLFKNYYE